MNEDDFSSAQIATFALFIFSECVIYVSHREIADLMAVKSKHEADISTK